MDMHVAAYLDLLDCASRAAGHMRFFLSQDKATAKKMFAFHGIRTPYFATSYRGPSNMHTTSLSRLS